MTVANNNLTWEKVLPTNTAEAVKRYVRRCLNWRAHDIDIWPSSKGFKAYCEANELSFDNTVSEFFDYADDNAMGVTPDNYVAFIKENAPSGIKITSITRNGETFAVDDEYVDPTTKLLALLGIEFAAIATAIATFVAWVVPFI